MPAITAVSAHGTNRRFDVRVKGRTELVRHQLTVD